MTKHDWDLYPAFRNTIGGLMPKPPKNILLAISGGPDSMALWDLMVRWNADNPKSALIVGHVNHGLRGGDSEGDAAFVARWAASLGTKCHVARVPTKVWSRRNKKGIEESARVLRYRALARLARSEKCPFVLTAHTMDDQVETFFMNLIRGAGPGGLAAMSPDSPWPIEPNSHQPRLIRPLLNVSKSELLLYLRRRKLPYRLDRTNLESIFFRNRLRPMLRQWEKWRPGFFARVARLTELQRVEEDFWREYLKGPSRRVIRRKNGRAIVNAAALSRYHLSIQRRILRLAGHSDFASVEKARKSAGLNPRKIVHRRRVSRAVQPFPVPGQISWRKGDGSSHVLSAAWVSHLPPNWKQDPRRAYMNAEAVDIKSLCRRFWRPGDRFQPLGMAGRKKLSDFFMDAKVPVMERGSVPLVADARGILWIAGHRLAERARVSPSTRRILEFRIS